MKRCFLFLLLGLIFAQSAFAGNDYVMVTDFPIKKIVVRDDDVLSVDTVYTLENTKQETILRTKVEAGETIMFLFLPDSEMRINVEINAGEIVLNKKKGIRLYKLDYPEEIE